MNKIVGYVRMTILGHSRVSSGRLRELLLEPESSSLTEDDFDGHVFVLDEVSGESDSVRLSETDLNVHQGVLDAVWIELLSVSEAEVDISPALFVRVAVNGYVALPTDTDALLDNSRDSDSIETEKDADNDMEQTGDAVSSLREVVSVVLFEAVGLACVAVADISAVLLAAVGDLVAERFETESEDVRVGLDRDLVGADTDAVATLVAENDSVEDSRLETVDESDRVPCAAEKELVALS